MASSDNTAPKGILLKDLHKICENLDTTLSFCYKYGLLKNWTGLPCPKTGCRGIIKLYADSKNVHEKKMFKCSARAQNCYFKRSIRHGPSWFSNSNLSIATILEITYCWVYDYPTKVIQRELDIGSDTTLVDWKNYCREVCSVTLEKENEMIGGEGKIVEIDESKFGKRKYNRGRKVTGQWVLGGIERGSNRMFMKPVEKRDRATLLAIIKDHVLPGTTVYSDCWKAYDCLSDEGFIHGQVNHSIEFVSPEGVHTQRIESTWRAIKAKIGKYGTRKHLYDGYLAEYMVKKKYLSDRHDKFEVFLKLISKLYDPNNLPTTESAQQDGPSNTAGSPTAATIEEETAEADNDDEIPDDEPFDFSDELFPEEEPYFDTSADLFE